MARTFDLHQVPPGAQVWQVEGDTFLVWFNENVEPPIPMAWKVSGPDEAEALGITKVTRKFRTYDAFAATGALRFGNTRELVNTDVDPREQVLSVYESEVRVKPWLADPEVMTLWMQAALEGRGMSQAEMQGTEWWRSHTRAQRQWFSLNASDPATADQLIADNRRAVRSMMSQAGLDGYSDELVRFIADQWTTGEWSQSYAADQVRYLADPRLGNVDPKLREMSEGVQGTVAYEDEVRRLMETWVGPAVARNFSDSTVSRWASKYRENAADARAELESFLRQQRLRWFPEYEDPTLTYEDIAAVPRELWRTVLGQEPDETDNDFTKTVRMNDLAETRQFLRRKGLEEGNNQVANDVQGDLIRAFSNIRRTVV